MAPVTREVPKAIVVDGGRPFRSAGKVKIADRTPSTFVGQGKLKPESVTSDESTISSDSVYNSQEEEELKAEELLEKANRRLLQVRLQDELKELKIILREKDTKLAQLAGQLKRATASKCDLVVACTEIEQQKEEVEKEGEARVKQMKQSTLFEMEARAQMEREFMNEISKLSEQMSDMERRHRNMMLEKDFEIAQLHEEVRKLKSQSVRKSHDQPNRK